MRLYSPGKKEPAPLLLYLPQKQSGFLCPPVRGGQTTNTRKKRQQAVKSDTTKPNSKASRQRSRHPLPRRRGREVPGWLDTLEDEYYAMRRNRIYVSIPDENLVALSDGEGVIDGETHEAVGKIETAASPSGLALHE